MTASRPSLDSLIALAVAGGREALAARENGIEAAIKADGSPVTIADRRAEAVILQGLSELAPDTPVLAEEASASGHAPRLGARFFCVDPIDGTRDFIAGGSEFTVNIAYIEDGAPILGVVFAPALGALYAGEPGRAFKSKWDARTGAETEPPHAIHVAPHTGLWRVTASRHSARARMKAFLDALGEAEEKPCSSSVKFCWIAEGAADLYPRFGDVFEWDAAAGHALLRAAGGSLMRLDGTPVTYGCAEQGYIIDGFVAFGDASAEAEGRRVLALMPRDAR